MLDVLKRKPERWFGHVQRRDRQYMGRRMMRLKLPGRRPKRRFVDVENMNVGVREEDAEDRVRWRQRIRCGEP